MNIHFGWEVKFTMVRIYMDPRAELNGLLLVRNHQPLQGLPQLKRANSFKAVPSFLTTYIQ